LGLPPWRSLSPRTPDLVVDPVDLIEGSRRAVLAAARTDLRGRAATPSTARQRYRRRVRPLGPLAPAGVHPRRRQALYDPDPDWEIEGEVSEDYQRVKLSRLHPGEQFAYVFDLGAGH
jgi:hypothetical protein